MQRRDSVSATPRERLHRAFAEFLAIPTAMVAGFVLLAFGTNAAESATSGPLAAVRTFIQARVFTNASTTAELLGTAVGGIITVSSITISLLLVAVQQSSSAFTDNVLDQFMRRRLNQSYFGFFVGLSAFSLLTLSTVHDGFNPVLGASLVFSLTVVALVMLLVLFYTTLNQMRPEEIIAAIHKHTIAARAKQLRFIGATRREPIGAGPVLRRVVAKCHGFVALIALAPIRRASQDARGEVEVELRVSLGTFVAYGDVIAHVHATSTADADAMVEAVEDSIRLELQRDLGIDAASGIEELELIAWTSISTAKANPGPGLLAIRNLRNLLAHWLEPSDAVTAEEPAPVVYADNTLNVLMNTLESLAVAPTESMQHQCFTEIVLTCNLMFERLDAEQRPRAERLILRMLSGLGDFVLTERLDAELRALARVLQRGGAAATASAVNEARQNLEKSVGVLHSRSTRVPRAGSPSH
jgi:uncharacterized membrane protein